MGFVTSPFFHASHVTSVPVTQQKLLLLGSLVTNVAKPMHIFSLHLTWPSAVVCAVDHALLPFALVTHPPPGSPLHFHGSFPGSFLTQPPLPSVSCQVLQGSFSSLFSDYRTPFPKWSHLLVLGSRPQTWTSSLSSISVDPNAYLMLPLRCLKVIPNPRPKPSQ
jgi:hypothetical protein